ncbi:aspartyl protease family protein [Stenotrophomonas indicatrix]
MHPLRQRHRSDAPSVSITRSSGIDLNPFRVDTGADGLAISRSIVPKASVVIDDRTENTGSDGVTTLDYSTRNDVEIGGLDTRTGPVVVDYRNRPFDAVLGWKFFEGKVVEIDYDRQQLVVHRNLPDVSGYTRANVRWIDNTPAIEVTLGNGDAIFKPWLALPVRCRGAGQQAVAAPCGRRHRTGVQQGQGAAASTFHGLL